MAGRLEGKVAIVTGAGRGIGRADAEALAAEGAAVVVNDHGSADWAGEGPRDRAPAEEVVAAIADAGGRAVADTTDVSDWDAVGGIVELAIASFGRLDIVVNNAGINRLGTIDAISRRDWELTIAVHLNGSAALCHWAGAHWAGQGPEAGRRIVNTTSGVGLWPMPNNPMYAAAKAGIAGLTQSCAIDLARLGVRVNAVAPVARSRISQDMAGDFMKPPAEGFDRMDPANVGAVVAYLASPSCRFTGRLFGIIGDSLTLLEGWSVGHAFANDERTWSVAEIDSALAEVPAQHRTLMQGLFGPAESQIPVDDVASAIAAVEQP